MSTDQVQPVIKVENLDFGYGAKKVLKNVSMSLQPGSRCLLVGDNGAVRDMMKETQAKFPERRDQLLELLQIDLDWMMNEIILLDEITTDLDVITRSDFLNFLKQESEERGITIVYATHIFGGIDTWATHIGYLSDHELKLFQPLDEVKEFQEFRASPEIHSPLLRLVELWLRRERDERIARMGVLKEREERLAEEADKAKDGSSRMHSKIASGFTAGRLAYKQAVDDWEEAKAERRAAAVAAAAAEQQ